MHYIELCINEASHTANSGDPILPTPAAGNSICTPSFERLECLWASVNAIKLWLDAFFTLPPSACLGFSFIFWAQLSRCLVTLYRLSTSADPSWDCQAVRNTVDLLVALDRIADRLEMINNEAGEGSNDGLFVQIFKMGRLFRAWAAVKMASEGEGEGEAAWPYGGCTSTGAGDNMADLNPLMMQSLDFGNDMWLQEVLGFR